MGVSTDGILFYGFSLDEDEDPPWDDSWEEWPDYMHKDTVEKVKDLGVEISTHCSGEYPMYYIHVAILETVASRGHPEEVNLRLLGSTSVCQNADDKLKEACRLLGIPFEQPKWWLASYWG